MICDQNLHSERVVLDKEVMGYFGDQIMYDQNDAYDAATGIIKEGAFGFFVKEFADRSPLRPMIFSIRKALCDFGQYLNGVLKGGGYDGRQICCNIEGGCSPLLNNLVTNTDFPFLALHGDQPASALNIALFQIIRAADVNNQSHALFVTELSNTTEIHFANYQGIITSMPAESLDEPRKRFKAKRGQDKRGGGIKCYTDISQEELNLLEDFFMLCVEFKMPAENIPIYNDFYNKFIIGNGDKKSEEFRREMDKLHEIIDRVNGLPGLIHVSKLKSSSKNKLTYLEAARKGEMQSPTKQSLTMQSPTNKSPTKPYQILPYSDESSTSTKSTKLQSTGDIQSTSTKINSEIDSDTASDISSESGYLVREKTRKNTGGTKTKRKKQKFNKITKKHKISKTRKNNNKRNKRNKSNKKKY